MGLGKLLDLKARRQFHNRTRRQFHNSYRPRARFSSAFAIQCKVPKRLKVPHAKKRMKKKLKFFFQSTTSNCRCEMAQSNLFADFFPHYHHYTKTTLFRLNFTIFLKNTASYIVAQHPSLSTSN